MKVETATNFRLTTNQTKRPSLASALSLHQPVNIDIPVTVDVRRMIRLFGACSRTTNISSRSSLSPTYLPLSAARSAKRDLHFAHLSLDPRSCASQHSENEPANLQQAYNEQGSDFLSQRMDRKQAV